MAKSKVSKAASAASLVSAAKTEGEALRHTNNFDLLRLFAAASVFVSHMVQHGTINLAPLTAFMHVFWHAFPGVPIFFIITGFLISTSWLKNPGWKKYLKARALRIFPALWVSTTVTTFMLWYFGYLEKARLDQIWSWWSGTMSTTYMYHTPDPLKGFSGGMPNASLWTIPIEIQFYVFLPFLLWLVFRKAKSKWPVYAFMGLSLLMVYFNDFGITMKHPDPTNSVFRHFWWFGMGVAFRLEWADLRKYVEGKFLLWLPLHLVWFTVLWLSFEGTHMHLINTLPALTLAPLVLAAAFTRPGLAERVLRGNDFSYGLYLFHRPYIHATNHFPFLGPVTKFVAVMVLSIASAVLSWKFIEKPALKLK